MPRESNYFEEAYELCNHEHSLVARTAETLYEALCRQNVESGSEPKGQFNLQYFFLSVARVLSRQVESSGVEKLFFLEPCKKIKAFNFPSETDLLELNQSHFQELGLIDSYIGLVSEQSDVEGDEFDVQFAVRVACDVIDASKFKWIIGKCEEAQEQPSEMSEKDFDYWLSGFNSDL